jgi:hypothetical protein
LKGGSHVKKALFLAAAAGGLLVSSAPPHRPVPTEEGVGYPPCSRSLRDRCIQLNERGVASAENLAINRGEDSDPGERYAGGPDGMMPPPPPPGMMGHHGPMHPGMMPPGGVPEQDSVVAPPPPGMIGERPMRMAMNDYPPCADAMSDRCAQRRVVVVHRERMLRIGERG